MRAYIFFAFLYRYATAPGQVGGSRWMLEYRTPADGRHVHVHVHVHGGSDWRPNGALFTAHRQFGMCFAVRG